MCAELVRAQAAKKKRCEKPSANPVGNEKGNWPRGDMEKQAAPDGKVKTDESSSPKQVSGFRVSDVCGCVSFYSYSH